MFLFIWDFSSPFVVLLHTEKRSEKPYELLIFKRLRTGGTLRASLSLTVGIP